MSESKMPQLTIRRADADDVGTIVRIVNAGGPDGKPRKALPDKLPAAYRSTFEMINRDANQWLMVAEVDHDNPTRAEIVGTFHLTYITYLAGLGRPDAQVEAIHVKASHRRQGIGSRMLEWVIAEARKRHCRRIQLTTDKQRTEAHPVYLKLGFNFTHEGAKLYL